MVKNCNKIDESALSASIEKQIVDSCALPDELRNLFIPSSEEDLMKRLQPFVALSIARLTDRDLKIWNGESCINDIAKHFQDCLPKSGESLDALVGRLRRHVLPYCRNKRAPGYLAQMDLPPTDISVFAGLLTLAMAQDPIAFSSAPSGTFVEKQLVDWLSRVIYPDHKARGGVITTGGTQSNMQALLLLRNVAFERLGLDVSELGIAEAVKLAGASGAVLIASEQAHESIFCAARYIGLGEQSVIKLHTNSREELSVDDLRATLAKAISENKIVIGIVLTACTTGSGSVDPIEEAISIAKDFNVSVHVDAAHGGMLLFSDQHRSLLKGIERSTTATIDPHKILGVNQPLGFLAVRDRELLDHLGKIRLRYYVPSQEPDLGQWTIDNSRNLNALGAWLLLRYLGHDGYSRIVDHLMNLAGIFSNSIQRSGRFEVLCPNGMNVVAFRTQRTETLTLEEKNKKNEAVLRKVLGTGRFAISWYVTHSGEKYLRTVFSNPATTINDVLQLVDVLIDAVDQVFGQHWDTHKADVVAA